MASLGVQCEDKALGMSSLGVFCDGVIPPIVERPTGNDWLPEFDRYAERKTVTSRIEFILENRTKVTGYAPEPGELTVSASLAFTMAANSSVEGTAPVPGSLTVGGLQAFEVIPQTDVERIPGAPPVEPEPGVATVTSEIEFRVGNDTTVAYLAPLVPTLTVASEVRFSVFNETRISGVKGVSPDEDDVEVLLLAMQLFRDRE
jgi:hypothetical protein